MASITIRNLDNEVKHRLRLKAAQNNRSMEEEVRVILRDALQATASTSANLTDIARAAVEPYGGFEIQQPKRDDIRNVF